VKRKVHIAEESRKVRRLMIGEDLDDKVTEVSSALHHVLMKYDGLDGTVFRYAVHDLLMSVDLTTDDPVKAIGESIDYLKNLRTAVVVMGGLKDE